VKQKDSIDKLKKALDEAEKENPGVVQMMFTQVMEILVGLTL